MTSRQFEVLRLIAREVVADRPIPTIRELGKSMSIRSTNAVAGHVRALRKQGLLQDPERRARFLGLTDRGWLELRRELAARRQTLEGK